jgi:quercetin dioxygenase-like cupin family protein
MDIRRAGTEPSAKGPADYFTGTVRIDPLAPVRAPSRTAANTVTFEPGARTAWHTHPLGQTLIVVSGCGRVQRRSRSSGQAMSCGSSRARNIGTVPPRRRR